MSIVQGLGYSIEGPGAADLLPEPAGNKLRAITQLRDDARATLRPITEQIRELQIEWQSHLVRLKKLTDPRGIGGDSLDGNNISVKDAQRRADKIAAELARLREVEEVRAHRYGETSGLVQNLEDYVRRGRPSGTIFAAVADREPPQLKGKENFADAIEARRRQVRVCLADRHAVESAPVFASNPKAKNRERVSRLRSVGQPSVGRMVAFEGAEAEFPTQTIQAQVHMQKELGLTFIEMVDPLALIAWLFPDQLISALDREIDLVADDANALDDAVRATKLATIAADLLAV
jgi:hypothetical protein